MTVEINYRFLLRSGTAAQAVTANEVLLANEIGYEADTGKLKIGDGATAWLSLPYFTVLDTVLRARLATAAALPANTYSNGSSGAGATLTMTSTGTLTVDGIVTALNDVIVVGSESTKSHNGVYKVTTAGAVGIAAVLTRSTRFDAPDEIPGRLITVGPEGTANASQTLLCTTAAAPTVGTTNITFAQLGAGGAGGDTFAVASGADTITATFSPAPTLVDGLQFKVRAAAANATATPTFNPNSLGALTLYKLGGAAMAAGDISGAGHELIIRYRASPARYELVNPAGVQQPIPGTGMAINLSDPRKPVFSSTLGSIALSGNPTTYAGLPGGLTTGDAGKAYLVQADNRVYIWSGTAFPASGAGVFAVYGGPPTWTAVTFAGAWANFGSGYSPVAYCKDQMGAIRLRGLAKSGSGTIFTLPVGYRPPYTLQIQAGSTSPNSSITVNTNGDVVANSFTTYMALDGISFLTI